MITKNTKVTLGAVVAVLTFLISVALGVDHHVKSQIDPLRVDIRDLVTGIRDLNQKVDKIYEILIITKEGH